MEGTFTADITSFDCTCFLEVRHLCPSAMDGVTVRDVEDVLFLSIGYKELVFSHHFGVCSCYGAFCPNSLVLCSRWVVGRTELAPPSFGVSLPPSPVC